MERGLKSYNKYDFEAFKHRFDIFYKANFENTNYAEIKKPDRASIKKAKLNRRIKDIVFYFPRKIRNGIIYWKKYGFKATIKRLIFGKPKR